MKPLQLIGFPIPNSRPLINALGDLQSMINAAFHDIDATLTGMYVCATMQQSFTLPTGELVNNIICVFQLNSPEAEKKIIEWQQQVTNGLKAVK